MRLFGRNSDKAVYVDDKKRCVNVIKNFGSGDFLIWRHPEEDFNVNSTLTVMLGEEAIFVKDGIIEQVFDNGIYELSIENYPFIRRLSNAFIDGICTFNCVVYFVRKTYSMSILWGTSSPIQVRDKLLGIATKLRARGAYKIQIDNSQKFLTKIIGNHISPQTQQELVDGFFANEFQSKIKSSITRALNETQTELLGIEARLDEFAETVAPFFGETLEDYGLKMTKFSIVALTINDDELRQRYDEIGLAAIAKLRNAQADKGVMGVLGDDWCRQQVANILGTIATNQFCGDTATQFLDFLIKTSTDTENNSKTCTESAPLIFLAHSALDKNFGDALRDFIVGLGVKNNQLIYTSHPLHKVPLDENFCDYMRRNLGRNVFMIALWSDAFLENSACLTEIGVQWALNKDYTNIFVPMFNFDNPKFHRCVVDTKRKGIMLDGANCKTDMIELKNKIKNMFNLTISEEQSSVLLDDFMKKIGTMIHFEETVFDNNSSNHAVVTVQHKSTTKRNEVYISYEQNGVTDKKYLVDELYPVLKQLTVNHNIKIWYKDLVNTGEKTQKVIQEHRSAAKVVILMLSPNFINSDFIRNHELPDLFQAANVGVVTIIPVPVEYVQIEGTIINCKDGRKIPLADYQPVCDLKKPLITKNYAERKNIYDKIYEEIKYRFKLDNYTHPKRR